MFMPPNLFQGVKKWDSVQTGVTKVVWNLIHITHTEEFLRFNSRFSTEEAKNISQQSRFITFALFDGVKSLKGLHKCSVQPEEADS